MESSTLAAPAFTCNSFYHSDLKVFKANCIGYFRSDFFTLDEVLQRQADIKKFIAGIDAADKAKLEEFERMYLATEHMRVELQQQTAAHTKKLRNEFLETELELARLKSKEAYLMDQLADIKEEMKHFGINQ